MSRPASEDAFASGKPPSDTCLSTQDARQKIEPALERQRQRFSHHPMPYNSHMSQAEIREFCRLGSREQAFLQTASSRYPLNPRSLKKVLTVSRTLADLDECDVIECRHLAEALQYRGSDLF
jgi:magnesium chelatase family protein